MTPGPRRGRQPDPLGADQPAGRLPLPTSVCWKMRGSLRGFAPRAKNGSTTCLLPIPTEMAEPLRRLGTLAPTRSPEAVCLFAFSRRPVMGIAGHTRDATARRVAPGHANPPRACYVRASSADATASYSVSSDALAGLEITFADSFRKCFK